MLSEELRSTIATQIYRCFQQGEQIPLLSAQYPDLEMEDAYRIQEKVVASFQADGRKIKGYKIGLTSKAMQEMAGTDEPDYSAMLDHMFLPEASHTPRSDWQSPMVEIELAFVMKERLEGPGINVADVIRATDFVLPAIEIVDFRVAMAPGMTVRDTISDLAAVGGVVLGGNPLDLKDFDVRGVRGDLLINGEVRESGCSDAVLGNPLTAVAWLANKLSEFGVTFEPGDVILSGSFLRALPVQAGDEVVARFDNGFGDVLLTFD
ncbi:4-oxalocrotonate decarboxylase [Parahaliea maris]|uniref:4-oxalocrotonate decarboxylase n=1 Tax=Parahaliea maris TaxID=2716870 RepID=A0A5C9A5F7_9GAMM|nr:fumarylacetoacetate hydrolase family protein [Parahaliea maris]TXS96018.1 4-oxalocrotonate decarboxylase [Parahaliea maris]